jgi:hypothetical protein
VINIGLPLPWNAGSSLRGAPDSRCKTPPIRAGLQIHTGEWKEAIVMILLALLLILVLIRRKRTKLKIELDL